MAKIIKCFLFFCIFFSSFLLDVNAKEVRYQSGNCIYNFTIKKNQNEEVLSIKISQDDKGKINYYFNSADGKLTDPEDKRWKEESKFPLFGIHISKDDTATFWTKHGHNHYTYCPKYAHLKGKYKIYFSDKAEEDGYMLHVQPEAGTNISLTGIISSIEDLDALSIIKDDKVKKFDNCEELLGDEFISLLKNIVLILRILIPILLNVFGVIDFGAAIFAGDEEKMKKGQRKFVTRLIIGVVIFLIPSILKLVLTVAHSIWPVIDNSLCGIIG